MAEMSLKIDYVRAVLRTFSFLPKPKLSQLYFKFLLVNSNNILKYMALCGNIDISNDVVFFRERRRAGMSTRMTKTLRTMRTITKILKEGKKLMKNKLSEIQ